MGTSESAAIDAALLAIEEINARGGLLGRPIEPVVIDNMSDSDRYAREAERLITAEKVCTIFGCWTSASRKAVAQVVEKYDHLLIYPMQYEGLEQSPHVVYTGALPNQQVMPAVRWCCDHLGKRFFIVGSDYVWPRATSEVIRDAVAQWGGTIAGEEYLPMESNDAEPVVQKIRQTRPDVILEMIAGDSKVAYYRALRKAGVTAQQIPSMSFSSPQPGLTARDCAGDYAAWNYFESIATPVNRAFVARFRARFGPLRLLSDPLESSYVGVHLWAQAVQAAGVDDAGAIRRALGGRRLQAPEGEVRVDPQTRHLWKTARVARMTSTGTAEIVWSSEQPIRPVVFPASRSRAEWEAFLTALYQRWGGQWAAPGPESPPGQPRPAVPSEELAQRPSPFDALKRRDPMVLPANAPPEVVAVLGDPVWFPLPRRTIGHWMAQTGDGRLLAVPCGTRILLFDTQTGRLVRTLTGHTNQAYRPVFSPDGKRLASGSGNYILRVWDVATGHEELAYDDHAHWVWSAAFDPEGNRLVSADSSGTIKVRDARGGLLKSPGISRAHTGRGVNQIAFSPDGKRLATASLDGTCKLWDTADWHEVCALCRKRGRAFESVAWSGDGALLAAGDDTEVIVWNAGDFAVVHTLKTPGAGLIAFTPDAHTLVTARHDCSRGQRHAFTRWDVATGTRQATLELPTAGSYWRFFSSSPDGKTVYVSAASTRKKSGSEPTTPRRARNGFRLAVTAWSGMRCADSGLDGRTLASGGDDRTVCLWDLAGGRPGEPMLPFRRLSGHKDTVWCVAFSPDGTLLATSGSNDGLLFVWDLASGRKVRELSGHSRKSPRVAFSPDGSNVAAGGADGTVNVWDVLTGKRDEPLRWNDGPVRSVAFSSDGRLMASGDRGSVQVIDRRAGRRLHTFHGATLFTNLSFSPSGATLAATSDAPDARLRLWDVKTGQEQASGTGHTGHIMGLSLDPSGWRFGGHGLLKTGRRGSLGPSRFLQSNNCGPSTSAPAAVSIARPSPRRAATWRSDCMMARLLSCVQAPD